MKIKSVIRRPTTGKFYDISVAKNHNFLANSCLVHNCNTSAQNAVIVGVSRGLNEVDELDIIQMAGRAGRFGKAPYGNVYLICDSTSVWKKKVANPRNVTSTLLDIHALAFHLCAEIKNGTIEDYPTMYQWYKRTLASIQQPLTNEHINQVLMNLQNWKAVKVDERGFFTILPLGKISATLYYHPEDVHHWWQCFNHIHQRNLWDSDLCLAYALSAPTMQLPYISRPEVDSVNAFIAGCRQVWQQGPSLKPSTLARDMHDLLTGNKPTPQVRSLQNDIERVIGAITWIFGVSRIPINDTIQSLSLRVKYGVSKKLVMLVQLKGVGTVRARRLVAMGITTWQDIIRYPEKVAKVMGEKNVKAITMQARTLLRSTQTETA